MPASLTWKRRQVRHPAYAPGDAREWIDATGRFLVRFVRRAYGVAMTPHWFASEIVDGCVTMLGRHRKKSAAFRTCERRARVIAQEEVARA
jgi:hypothetical protein